MSTQTPTLPRPIKDHGNGPVAWDQNDPTFHADKPNGWKPKPERTDWTLIDLFGTDVIYVGDDGASHATPDCDLCTGTVCEVTDWADRGSHVCWCIDLEAAPTGARLLGNVKTDRDVRAKQEQQARQSAKRASRTQIRPEQLPTDDEVEQWLTGLGRKVQPGDVTLELNWAATLWAEKYDGDFEFMLDMAAAATRNLGRNQILSQGQAKGVLNCWRADVLRRARQAKEAELDSKAAESTDKPLDLSDLPSGMYAVPNGDTRLKVKIDVITKGKWNGWVFVHDGAEYGTRRKYGNQRPGGTYRGDIEPQLRAILDDPVAAMSEYGRLTGTCGRCGRALEDEESVARGLGSVCYSKLMGV